MLEADQASMLADTAQSALQLRKLEFDYLNTRYTALGGLSSILTGFAYVGVVKTGALYSCDDRCAARCAAAADANDEPSCAAAARLVCASSHCWLVSVYYSFIVLSLVLSLYNFCLCSFLAIYGYGHALRGADGGSVAHATAVFLKYRRETLRFFCLSVATLLVSVNLLAFLKIGVLGTAASVLSSTLVLFGVCNGVAVYKLL